MADIVRIETGEVLLPQEETEEHERKGTVWTAMAHVFTAVFGSGVLALPWSVMQLGWIAGPLALIGFSCITYYTSMMLADTYRAPDPVTGSRNRTYMEAVRAYLSMGVIIFMLHCIYKEGYYCHEQNFQKHCLF